MLPKETTNTVEEEFPEKLENRIYCAFDSILYTCRMISRLTPAHSTDC